MKTTALLPTWAPRIKAFRIRRLYESDARGLIDLDLLDDVGWALYERCESFLQANEARMGRARCPVCGAMVEHKLRLNEVLRCAGCGWECPLRAYMDTIRDQQLNGGPEVAELFQQYVDAFPKAKAPTEKMLLIDQLIHGFHHFISSGRTRRPVCVNLIDGHLDFVIDFLDRLSYGPGSTPGLLQNYEQWHEHIRPPTRKGRGGGKSGAAQDE